MKIYVRSMIAVAQEAEAALKRILVSCDLSQAESWIVAYLANEPNMKRALQFGDIHTETAGNALFHATTGCAHNWLIVTKGELWKCQSCGRDVTKLMRYVGK